MRTQRAVKGGVTFLNNLSTDGLLEAERLQDLDIVSVRLQISKLTAMSGAAVTLVRFAHTPIQPVLVSNALKLAEVHNPDPDC